MNNVYEKTSRKIDACMCGCGYLNGGRPMAMAQFFLIVGGLLSVGSLVDCSYARIDGDSLVFVKHFSYETLLLPSGKSELMDFGEDEGIVVEEITGVGFVFFQTVDGYVRNERNCAVN